MKAQFICIYGKPCSKTVSFLTAEKKIYIFNGELKRTDKIKKAYWKISHNKNCCRSFCCLFTCSINFSHATGLSENDQEENGGIRAKSHLMKKNFNYNLIKKLITYSVLYIVWEMLHYVKILIAILLSRST